MAAEKLAYFLFGGFTVQFDGQPFVMDKRFWIWKIDLINFVKHGPTICANVRENVTQFVIEAF